MCDLGYEVALEDDQRDGHEHDVVNARLHAVVDVDVGVVDQMRLL